jgi:hypothetical protein
MKEHEYPLESEGSSLHLLYLTLGLNPATTVPISYFLTAAHSQVRFDVSIESVVFRSCWQRRTSSLAMMLQKLAAMFVLLCGWRVGLEILSVSIKGSSMRRRQSTAWLHAFGPPSLTTYLLCRLLSSNLESRYAIDITIPFVDNSLFTGLICSKFLIKNHEPYPADLHRHAIVDQYRYNLLSCPSLIILWSLIISSSLKPMANIIHLIHLFICAPLFIRWHAFVSLLLDDFTKSTTPLVSSPLLVHGLSPSSPCVTALSMKQRRHHEQAFSWLPCKLCLTPCAGDSVAGSPLTGW